MPMSDPTDRTDTPAENATTEAAHFDEWPVEADDPTGQTRYVGTTTEDVPVFYDDENRRLFGADVDEEEERIRPRDDETWDVEPGETIADGLERVGEAIGWESLSAFGEEHGSE